MSKCSKPARVDIDLTDKDVQKSAAMIQKSFRGNPVQNKLLEDGPPRWFKDGQELNEGVKYRIRFEDPDICALEICNVASEDGGRYTCKAYNQFGEAFDSAIVSVQAKIEKGPPNVTVKRHETITPMAKISGDSEPDVGWAKNDEDIE